MGSTLLQLTNKVLRRVNEVEVTESQFNSLRGMHAMAKDAVIDAISEINQQKWDWPFLAYQNTQLLQVGESEYSWPDDFTSVDWNSFQIVKDENNPHNKHLMHINRDEWYSKLKDIDEDSDPRNEQVPSYVFRSHGTGFGISPRPDKPYQIEFRYYRNPTNITNHDDVCDIPQKFDNILVWGALAHMNLFRENVEGQQLAEAKFQQGIKNMYLQLVGSSTESVTDTRVNFGGSPRTEAFK